MTTQRQIHHPEGLPACHAGHAGRHIVDARCPRAGGGHFIECQCRATTRHDSFEDALQQWCQDNRHPAPAQRPLPLDASNRAANVIRFGGLR